MAAIPPHIWRTVAHRGDAQMSREKAKRWYDRLPGDPETGAYISPEDSQNAIAQIYTDMAGVVQLGDGTNGRAGILYSPDPSLGDVDPTTFVGLDPAGWIELGNIAGDGSGGSGVTDHGALTGLADDDHPQYLTNARGDARYARTTAVPQPDGGAGPSQVTVGGAGSTGTSNTYSRSDHQHSISTGVPVALGPAASSGTASSVARSDHVHPRPTVGELGAEPAGAVATHVAAPDPHPGYLMPADVIAGTNVTVDASSVPGSVVISATASEGGGGGTGGATDHGALTGLADPDHPISAVQGLQAVLDGKAALAHTHVIGDLPSELVTDSEMTEAVSAHVAAPNPHSGYQLKSERGAANGYAPLDANSRLPDANLPSTLATDAEVAAAITAHTSGQPHVALASTAPTALTPDITAAVGTGTTSARADHVHNVPAAAPTTNLTAATTNAEGVGTSFARNDHSHAITANVAASALGTVAAVGTSAALARADHVHPFPTAANVGADPAGTASSQLAAHTGAADPHPQYLTQPEGDARYAALGFGDIDHSTLTGRSSADQHPVSAITGLQTALNGKAPTAHTHGLGDLPPTLATETKVSAAITEHAAAADPHPGYQLESEKGAANGYASLDATALIPVAQVPTGTTDTTVALGSHSHAGVYDPAGAASSAVDEHLTAENPHPQYLLMSESTGPQSYSVVRTTRPNSFDRLIEVRDDSTTPWVPVNYRSGIRSVTSLLVNGWTASKVELTRENNQVFIDILGLNGEHATSALILTLPTGFQKASRAGTWNVEPGTTNTVNVGSSVMLRDGSAVNIKNGSVQATWFTNNAIPTALPGTPVGNL